MVNFKPIAWFLILGIVFGGQPGAALAQNAGSTSINLNFLQNPITDLFNDVLKINFDISGSGVLDRAGEEILKNQDIGAFWEKTKEIYEKINSKIKEVTGADIPGILKIIGNYLVKTLEFIVDLIKLGLSKL